MKVENKKTLLLVEDEALIALAKQMELEKYGYNVLTINTGEKAVAISKEIHEIDLILMDIDLGRGIDGTETAEIILKDHGIPVVFLSSHTDTETVEKTEKITSYGYVVKSSNITVLDASIKMAFKLFEANKKIYESEEKYRTLFEKESDAIFLYDPDTTNIIDTNEATSLLYGYDKDELIGMSCLKLSDQAEESASSIDKIREDDEVNIPLRFHRKKDGTVFPVDIKGFTFTLNGKNVICAVSKDITEHKRAENKLQKSQYYLTKAQKMGKIGTWELDIKTNNLTWTDETYKIFGVPLGSKIDHEIFLNCVHPDDRNYVEEMWSSGLNNVPYDIEHRLIVNNKIKCIREKAEIEFDIKGNPIKAIGFAQDITDQKQADISLLENEQRFKQMFETNSSIKLIIDPSDGRIVESNLAAQKFYGYSKQTLNSMKITDINTLPDKAVRQEMLLAKKGERLHFNFRHRLSSGKIRDVEVYTGPIQSQNKTLLYSIIHDVTLRKHLEAYPLEWN